MLPLDKFKYILASILSTFFYLEHDVKLGQPMSFTN